MARTTYCRIVDDIEAKVTQLGEAHGYPMRLGYNASRGYHIQMTVQVWSLTPFYSVDFSQSRIGAFSTSGKRTHNQGLRQIF